VRWATGGGNGGGGEEATGGGSRGSRPGGSVNCSEQTTGGGLSERPNLVSRPVNTFTASEPCWQVCSTQSQGRKG
jgi:hypothetical protein